VPIKLYLMKKSLYLFRSSVLVLFIIAFSSQAQVVLKADGPEETYELINSILTPGKSAIEAADHNKLGNHTSFGRHIAEVWDADLKANVFEFYAHIDYRNADSTSTTDNEPVGDVAQKQRVEIKTFEGSPDNLKGTLGETITYQWKFKLPKGFQPSSNFTHLHQIKAVGGSQDMPIFTLTAKKGAVNQFNVVHNNVDIVANMNLSELEGVWVQITEVIKVGANGSYSILINRIRDGKNLLSYSNPNIETIRPDNTFIRPKWGIYRSLKKVEDLREEAVRFADFSIKEQGNK
jgi:hypothetical protein